MGGFFHGQPEVRYLDEYEGGRQKFMLLKPLTFHSDTLDLDITAPAGLVSDGESTPRLLAGFTGKPSLRSGVIHDSEYQQHHFTKEQTDALYREMMLADGVDEIHAQERYAAVDFYGRKAWDSGPSRLRVLSV